MPVVNVNVVVLRVTIQVVVRIRSYLNNLKGTTNVTLFIFQCVFHFWKIGNELPEE